ncbi:hypothetical protein [Streptomyces sp. NPDC002644]
MARYMADDDKLYRAVIETTYEDGRTVTFIHGPFTAKAPATSVIGKEERALARQQELGWRWQGPYTLDTRIETCDPTWKEV